MENVIARLVGDFENGKMSRRQLIQSLAMAATAAAAIAPSPIAAAGGFKTAALDHISYEVADYKRTRDFYADLMGMTVSGDDGKNQCNLNFNGAILLARNRPQPGRASGPRVDHIAYRIEDWDTGRVQVELERRRLKPRLDTGSVATPPHFTSFHVQDPDGFDLQISGIAKPGDSLYKK